MKMVMAYGAAVMAAAVMWATAQTGTANLAVDALMISVIVGAMLLAPFTQSHN